MLTVYHDGSCPICNREIAVMKRLNRKQHVMFVDISATGFDPAPTGKTLAELNAKLHVYGDDGQLHLGLDAMRAIYRTLGLGPLITLTELPGLRGLLDSAYAHFARRRASRATNCDSGTCTPQHQD
ncbi:thiol-disulfide oxidoreductase DCC family protein [Andreprevotia chitinilytica]|uniref:thiol-disulfide oxidoreductase DCC family protein n=1 Tax=Andreprevotia chitinilytica TaxID=396808 RepID=UPI000691813B|nr:DUF393 domain-containing protein [Andreprevotia chitinilytica]